jgi:hypothetical protein
MYTEMITQTFSSYETIGQIYIEFDNGHLHLEKLLGQQIFDLYQAKIKPILHGLTTLHTFSKKQLNTHRTGALN